MRLFKCQVCGNVLHFENTRCVKCDTTLGYLPEQNTLSALDPVGGEEALWSARAAAGRGYRFCDNARQQACNWLVPGESEHRFCLACRHNRTIPDISDPVNKEHWQKIEIAKRRAIYSFIRLRLPMPTRAEDPEKGLAFDFLADMPQGPQVMTGHDNGLITLALAEADDAERARRRTAMGEPYRALLGHFRHESGHYFWDRLVRDGGRLEECRAAFGDDRQDYGEALKRHYQHGTPADWQENFVSTYATAHPWEDFAETWAHYLHIVDTLEMARALGIGIAPRLDREGDLSAGVDFDPYRITDIHAVMEAWVPLTVAVNSLNRSMGIPDLYPFVLSAAVVAKLGFIQSLVHDKLPAG
ncbi:zinc-binding metallopeptidase family protein [Roseomonas marmotae]|uniref:Zinc-binding peptidase n=1 Tax=Roseomonas marmotae TaxID=2768161 RepID=A0ABS3KFM7_9PROT|nr:putative zinc-binding peptidase [Roseomonas marmotae]MBO1076245.1 putative zinc-binding peptidase [Roseomonas marmotae]QTI77872.1 putative zinc-binding peptidase [Roseomonas marmotae]